MKKAYRFDSLEEREKLRETFGEDHFDFDFIPNRSYSNKGYLYHNRGGNVWTSGEPDTDTKIVTFEEAMKEKQIMKKGDKIVCIGHDTGITIGKVYTVLEYLPYFYSSPAIAILDDDGDNRNCLTKSFKIVDSCLSLEDKIKLAKFYIGKLVASNDAKYEVEEINVVLSEREASSLKIASNSVCDALKRDGMAVVVSDHEYANPVELVDLVASSKSVKLNSSYTAVVSKDTIVVGCQTFPISILDELAEAREAIG